MELWSWFVILTTIILVPTICIVAFFRWIQRQRDLEFEKKAKAWEVFISLLSAVTVLVGGALVVGKYVDEQSRLERDRLAQARRESSYRAAEVTRQDAARLQQKHDQTQRLYDETMTTATRLASLDESDIRQLTAGQERTRFEEMYWAKLIGIESRDVEAAMVRLRRELETWASTRAKPDVSQAVLALSRECKAHLQRIEEEIAEKNRQIAQLMAIPK